jgi:hypothetical protein
MTDRLDALLAQPLEGVADNGFSMRVAAKIEHAAWWREGMMLFAPVAAVAAGLFFLPGDEITAVALNLSPIVAESGAIAFAAAVLALTITLEQRLRDLAL